MIQNTTGGKTAGEYFDIGVDYYQNGDYQHAIENWSRAIDLEPKFVGVYIARGAVYGVQRQYARAIADYNMAIELDPKFALPYNSRGIAYNAQNQYDRAIADYTKAIELDPKYALAYNSRGFVYDELKQYDRAIADYKYAVYLDANQKYAAENIIKAMNDKANGLRTPDASTVEELDRQSKELNAISAMREEMRDNMSDIMQQYENIIFLQKQLNEKTEKIAEQNEKIDRQTQHIAEQGEKIMKLQRIADSKLDDIRDEIRGSEIKQVFSVISTAAGSVGSLIMSKFFGISDSGRDNTGSAEMEEAEAEEAQTGGGLKADLLMSIPTAVGGIASIFASKVFDSCKKYDDKGVEDTKKLTKKGKIALLSVQGAALIGAVTAFFVPAEQNYVSLGVSTGLLCTIAAAEPIAGIIHKKNIGKGKNAGALNHMEQTGENKYRTDYRELANVFYDEIPTMQYHGYTNTKADSTFKPTYSKNSRI